MTLRLVAIGLICGLLSTACAEEPAREPATEGPFADADAGPLLEAREEGRIASGGDAEVGLTMVGDVAVDRDGHVYVVDRRDLRIRIYDEAGSLDGAFGGRGQGPGEFAGSPTIGLWGDTLWAVDEAGRRITLFTSAGAVLSARSFDPPSVPLHRVQTLLGLPELEERFPPQGGLLVPESATEDRLLVSALHLRYGVRPPGPGPDDTIRVPRIGFDIEGEIVDTIGWQRRPPPEAMSFEVRSIGGRDHVVPPPPLDDPLSGSLADGHVVIERRVESGPDPRFRVARFNLQGDPLFVLELGYSPRPYPDETLDSLAHYSAWYPGVFPRSTTRRADWWAFGWELAPQQAISAGEQERARDVIRGAMDFPSAQPPVQQLWLGDDGAIWLRREEDGLAEYRWLVIAADGNVRGEVSLPATSRLLWSEGDMFWARELDSLGVESLVRYRLERVQ